MAKQVVSEKFGWSHVFLTSFLVFLGFSLLLFFRRFSFDLFIANKAFASTSIVLVGLSFLLGPLAHFWPKAFIPILHLRKHFGIFGFAVAGLHVLSSLILMSGDYFSRLYALGKFSFEAELSMVFAIFAFFLFSIVAVTSIPSVEERMDKKKWLWIQRIGYIAFLFAAVHFFALKWGLWINPSAWGSAIPPASLLAFIFSVFVIAMRLIVIVLPRRA